MKNTAKIERAWEELDEWAREKAELGIDAVMLIRVVESFKTALTMEEMEEWCEEKK